MKQVTPLDALLSDLDGFVALYMDAWASFNNLSAGFFPSGKTPTPSDGVIWIENLDTAVQYTSGNQKSESHQAKALHQSTYDEFVERNTQGGSNHAHLGWMTIVLFYQKWDEYHRPAIQEFLGLQSDLLVPVFGDLRQLRNSIIHRKGIANNGVGNPEILNWFCKGDFIDLHIDHIFEMVRHVRSWAESVDSQGTV